MRQAACTHYVNQLYAVVLERVASVRRCNQSARCVVGADSGTMQRLEEAVRQYSGLARSAVRDYRQRVSSTVSTLVSAQTRHLVQLYSNHWSDFAVSLFNRTSSDPHAVAVTAEGHRLDTLPDIMSATFARPEVQFASFAGIDVVRDTSRWLDQFWRR